MHKSRLQELCQQKLWPLPKYSWLRDGPDHCPSFKASVFVNGANFSSVPGCKSSKEAQNDAALRAVLHFSADHSSSDLENVEAEPVVTPELDNEANQSAEPLADILLNHDFLPQYKLQLQNYAQRNHLSLPSYSIISKGPPHAFHFVASITVGEQDFRGPTSSKTVKEAENAAAKPALMSLSPDGLEQICSGYVKNLLQQLAQKEGLSLPLYTTSHISLPQKKMFYSEVVVEGEIFQGKATKSKKQAEINAAEMAYTSLEERRMSRNNLSKQLGGLKANVLETKYFDEMEKSINSQEDDKICPSSASTEIKKLSTKSFKDQFASQNTVWPAAVQITMGKESEESNCSARPQSESFLVHAIQPESVENLSICGSDEQSSAKCESYLLCNRVRVYTSIPDIEFPKGITLLPIDDNKWVAVRLEFPEE